CGDEFPAAVDDAKTVRVAIGGKAERQAVFRYLSCQFPELLGAGFGRPAAKGDVAPVVERFAFDPVIAKNFVKIAAARAPERVVGVTAAGVCDRREIDL